MDRPRILTGRPLETEIGFSRAIRVGNRIEVSGTAPTQPDGSPAGGDNPFEQAKACLEIIRDAIEELGGSLEHVYRTRMFITNASDGGEIGRAHGEFFGEVKPAATMVVVAGLLDERWLVEIEAYAEIPVDRKTA
ncbi:MAG: RidA family protein [Thermomicrobiales bacterium]